MAEGAPSGSGCVVLPVQVRVRFEKRHLESWVPPDSQPESLMSMVLRGRPPREREHASGLGTARAGVSGEQHRCEA